MSNPRFVPRSLCAEPHAFGLARTVAWVDPEGADRTELATAQLQHDYAVRIRLAAKERFGSVGAYARQIGQTSDRLGKVLRGEAIMRLEDVAAAQIHLGVLT